MTFSSVLSADYSSLPMEMFSRAGYTTCQYSLWNGSSWGSPITMPSMGGEAYWIILRNCPVRNEYTCATLDVYDDVNVIFYNGTSWTSATEVNAASGGENNDRMLDVAYEQNSGDAMIAYWDGTEFSVGYRIYNGTTLSGEYDLSYPGASNVDYLSLNPRPNSDQIIMLAMGEDYTLRVNIWTGTSWVGWTTLESSLPSNDEECFSAAFESLSDEALVVWPESGQNQPRYRTWNGSSWSSEQTMPSIGGVGIWFQLVNDPASNKMLLAVSDNQSDINVCTWSGSSWGSVQELETNTVTYVEQAGKRGFDIAYEGGGTEALIVYQDGTNTSLRYRTFNGSSWSSEQTASSIGSASDVVQLRQGTSTGEIFIGAHDTGDDLEVLRWNGSSMSSVTQLYGTLGGPQDTEPFMIAMPTASPLVPADIPYYEDFQNSIGDEWPSLTVSNNGTFTKFAGRYHNSAIRLALNTTIGETYSLEFDLYCIDSWNGSSSSSGPDYFSVSADSTTLINYTFAHYNTSGGYTYPISPDQVGEYGYTSSSASYRDGIYRKVEAVFTATQSVTTLKFAGNMTSGISDIDDESWGIDNVYVDQSRFANVSTAKSFNATTTSNNADYGSGLYWGDLDNDGDMDAIITGTSAKRMLNNNAGASFSSSSFGGGDVRRQGALLDIDNDGDLDFWASCVADYNTERLFTNNGAAAFTNAGNAGFSGPTNNENVVAGDVNHDGWPDIIMLAGSGGNFIGHHQGSGTVSLVGTTSSSYGLNGSGNYGDGNYASSGDVNNDGYIDFFYHYSTGKLFLSNGDGTYTQNARGISVVTGESAKVGSAWGDYDNDGDLDLFVPRYASGSTGYLWRDEVSWSASPVSGSFTDVTSSAKVTDSSSQRSCAWGDYDNDGDLDLFITVSSGNCVLYRNENDGTFRRRYEGAAVSASAQDCAFVDYDNDGDLDIAITQAGSSTILMENRTNDANYLKVRLVGMGAGRTDLAGIGTRVELWNAAGTTRLARRDIGIARGYGGQEPHWAHFGGVDPNTTYTLKAYFSSRSISSPQTLQIVPSGVSTTIGSRTIPQMATVTEDAPIKIIKWSEIRQKTAG